MFVSDQQVVLLVLLSLYLMPQLLSHRLVLSIIAFAGILLLYACSQASPATYIDSALANAPATPTKRTIGTAADSLNGIPGHTFGEPLRNFPGLVLLSKNDETGVRWYQMPAAQQRGWFRKYAQYAITYYQFQDGQFAMFMAVTMGRGGSPTLMRKEALSLFGPGKEQHDLLREINWEGERVRAMYAEKLTPPVTCWLEVRSKPLLAVQQAKQRAHMQADDALTIP